MKAERQFDIQHLLKDRIRLHKEYTLINERGTFIWVTNSRIYYGTLLLTKKRPKCPGCE